MAVRLAHLPLRLFSGAFILNSGLSKRGADPETAAYLHSGAVRVLPQLKDMPPEKFTRLLSGAEVTLGTALLLPVVPSAVAGAALTAFAAGLVRLYLTDPDARLDDGIRPTPQGIALAKDSWLLGIGLALLMGGTREKLVQKGCR